MSALTYVDSIAAAQAWINSRTLTLVGPDHPLWLGAHLKKLGGGEPKTYAFLVENFSTRSLDSAESPDMLAAITAEVYGGNRESAGLAAVALAEELSTVLNGTPVTAGAAVLLAVDDIQGPSWLPDGDHPRLLLNFTIRMRPA